jgi:hypothetical protein
VPNTKTKASKHANKQPMEKPQGIIPDKTKILDLTSFETLLSGTCSTSPTVARTRTSSANHSSFTLLTLLQQAHQSPFLEASVIKVGTFFQPSDIK